MLRLQQSAGNAAVTRMLAQTRPTLARAPGPVLQSLAVTGAAPVAGAADTFVVATGVAGVTVDATVDDPSKATPKTVKWSGGTAGASAVQRLVPTGAISKRVIKATAGGVTKKVTIHVPASALPGANPAAPISHVKSGTANPGTNFGLTVVTIGQQGVKRPAFKLDAHLDGTNWAFRVREIAHKYKVGVKSQGRKDITGPGDSDVKPSTIGPITTDLTPPGPGAANGPERDHFWSKSITEAHEQAHVDRFYDDPAFWPAAMTRFEATVEGTSVAFDPADKAAASIAGVKKANDAAFKTAIDTEHGAADAAEIGGSEPAAHGVSNPMYTALLAAIRDTVVPPKPTGTTATPGAGAAVTITWTATTANETGFEIERRVGATGAFTSVGTVTAADRTFTDATLAAGTKATYRVRAQGVKGNSAPSNNQTVTTTP